MMAGFVVCLFLFFSENSRAQLTKSVEVKSSIDGQIVDLACQPTWSGGANIDDITTVFSGDEAKYPTGIPVSGKFFPRVSLNTFEGISAVGDWALIAGGRRRYDSLCICLNYIITSFMQRYCVCKQLARYII